jgi:nitrous oxide reductase accessory protein NosL
MCDPHRRNFLGRLGLGGLLLTPLAAALSGCGSKGGWPDGMAEIKWDRDTCARCSMVISDRRFAGQVRGGPENTVFKFDDPGCLAFFLAEKAGKYPWLADAATKMWVADFNSKSREEMVWLDPRRAYYVTRTSPMGYNFAAVAAPLAGALDFTDMRQHTLAKGK